MSADRWLPARLLSLPEIVQLGNEARIPMSLDGKGNAFAHFRTQHHGFDVVLADQMDGSLAINSRLEIEPSPERDRLALQWNCNALPGVPIIGYDGDAHGYALINDRLAEERTWPQVLDSVVGIGESYGPAWDYVMEYSRGLQNLAIGDSPETALDQGDEIRGPTV